MVSLKRSAIISPSRKTPAPPNMRRILTVPSGASSSMTNSWNGSGGFAIAAFSGQPEAVDALERIRVFDRLALAIDRDGASLLKADGFGAYILQYANEILRADSLGGIFGRDGLAGAFGGGQRENGVAHGSRLRLVAP